jgi:hypothetical protein
MRLLLQQLELGLELLLLFQLLPTMTTVLTTLSSSSHLILSLLQKSLLKFATRYCSKDKTSDESLAMSESIQLALSQSNLVLFTLLLPLLAVIDDCVDGGEAAADNDSDSLFRHCCCSFFAEQRPSISMPHMIFVCGSHFLPLPRTGNVEPLVDIE